MSRALRYLAALLALTAFAYGYSRRGSSPPADITEVTYWGQGFGMHSDPSIRDFERKFPGVRVRMSSMSGALGTSDPTKLILGLVGDAPPDLVWLDRFTVGGFAARGAFRPLDDFLAASKVIKAEDFYPPCIAEARLDGQTFGIPGNTDVRALFYNKDLLVQEGLVDDDGEARPPRTWDELRDYALRLSRRDERGRLTRVGFIPNYGNSWFYLYAWQNGGSFLSPDGRRCTLDDPANVEALRYMVDIYDRLGGVGEVDAFAAGFQTGAEHPFFHGKVALMITGEWELNAIVQHAAEVNLGVAPAPVPEGRPVITWCGGWAFAIPTRARHPEWAWRLIEHLRSRDTVLRQMEAERSYYQSRGSAFIPRADPAMAINEELSRRYVFENPNLPAHAKEAVRVFDSLRPTARFRPVTPAGQLLWDEHVRAFERACHHVFASESDPVRAALAHGAQRVQVELDRLQGDRSGPTLPWGRALPILGVILLVGLGAAVLVERARPRSGARASYAGYLFASPFLLGFVIFTAGPILASLALSCCDYDGLGPPRWVGLDNYRELFAADPLFWRSLGNTAFMLLGLPLGIAAGLGIAMLLSRETRAMGLWRTAYYLPSIVPAVAASVLWIWILHPQGGVLNAGLRALGMSDPPNWLHGTARLGGMEFYWSKPALILMSLWGAGGGMVIWLAGLKGIPRSLYQAAALDGAGPWARFRHITLPLLSPYIFFSLVMGIIGTFQIFTQAYVMTAGGPADSTLFYAYYLFDNAFRYFRMGYASALAWVLFAIVLVLTALQLKASKRWVHYQAE